jgi:hypothetical protein
MRGLLIWATLTAVAAALFASLLTAWVCRPTPPEPRVEDYPAFRAQVEQKVAAECRLLEGEREKLYLLVVIARLRCDLDEHRRRGCGDPLLPLGGAGVGPGDLIPPQDLPPVPPVAVPTPRELGIDPK